MEFLLLLSTGELVDVVNDALDCGFDGVEVFSEGGVVVEEFADDCSEACFAVVFDGVFQGELSGLGGDGFIRGGVFLIAHCVVCNGLVAYKCCVVGLIFFGEGEGCLVDRVGRGVFLVAGRLALLEAVVVLLGGCCFGREVDGFDALVAVVLVVVDNEVEDGASGYVEVFFEEVDDACDDVVEEEVFALFF